VSDRLRAAYAQGHAVREEKPIELPDSLPEPDVAVVTGSQLDYAWRHPSPSEVVLAVEIAVTSQAFDRDKACIYARAGVAAVWLLDVPARRLEVHGEPQPDGQYRVVRVLEEDDVVVAPGLSVVWRVRDLLA
jgi:Uma2 family endonuclease